LLVNLFPLRTALPPSLLLAPPARLEWRRAAASRDDSRGCRVVTRFPGYSVCDLQIRCVRGTEFDTRRAPTRLNVPGCALAGVLQSREQEDVVSEHGMETRPAQLNRGEGGRAASLLSQLRHQPRGIASLLSALGICPSRSPAGAVVAAAPSAPPRLHLASTRSSHRRAAGPIRGLRAVRSFVSGRNPPAIDLFSGA
jgi:hypothetical protein